MRRDEVAWLVGACALALLACRACERQVAVAPALACGRNLTSYEAFWDDVEAAPACFRVVRETERDVALDAGLTCDEVARAYRDVVAAAWRAGDVCRVPLELEP